MMSGEFKAILSDSVVMSSRQLVLLVLHPHSAYIRHHLHPLLLYFYFILLHFTSTYAPSYDQCQGSAPVDRTWRWYRAALFESQV